MLYMQKSKLSQLTAKEQTSTCCMLILMHTLFLGWKNAPCKADGASQSTWASKATVWWQKFRKMPAWYKIRETGWAFRSALVAWSLSCINLKWRLSSDTVACPAAGGQKHPWESRLRYCTYLQVGKEKNQQQPTFASGNRTIFVCFISIFS